MGVYYSGVSKRTYKVDGIKFAFTNFFGKAPGLFNDNKRWETKWNRFETRSENTAREMKDMVGFVVYAGKTTKLHGTPVAAWKGQAILSDWFWDEHTVGNIVKVRGRYHYVPTELQHTPMWEPHCKGIC